MIELTTKDVLMSFGFLIPLYSEVSKDKFIELIKDNYDTKNPKINACIEYLENSDMISLKRETGSVKVEY